MSREDARAFWDAWGSDRDETSSVARVALLGVDDVYDAYRDRSERRAVGTLLGPPRPDWRILDLGCGPGRWTVRFAASCGEVVATDISGAMLDLAREECRRRGVADRVTFERRGFDELDEASWRGSFDGVLAMGVLLYARTEEIPAIAERIAGCLKPGGWLLHREPRSRRDRHEVRTHGPNAVDTYYKPTATYRDAFGRFGLHPRGRRSILPPNLALALAHRLFPERWRRDTAAGSRWLERVVRLQEGLVDPLARAFPEILWLVNSRRPTDNAVTLYRKSLPTTRP